MFNKLNDEIWESLLKASVEENSQNEINDYPPIGEINKIVLPKHYEMAMQKLIKRFRFQSKAKAIVNSSCKIASLIIMAMGISFAILLQFDEVRAACRNVIIYVYENYIQFDYDPAPNNETIPLFFFFCRILISRFAGKCVTFICDMYPTLYRNVFNRLFTAAFN